MKQGNCGTATRAIYQQQVERDSCLGETENQSYDVFQSSSWASVAKSKNVLLTIISE